MLRQLNLCSATPTFIIEPVYDGGNPNPTLSALASPVTSFPVLSVLPDQASLGQNAKGQRREARRVCRAANTGILKNVIKLRIWHIECILEQIVSEPLKLKNGKWHNLGFFWDICHIWMLNDVWYRIIWMRNEILNSGLYCYMTLESFANNRKNVFLT